MVSPSLTCQGPNYRYEAAIQPLVTELLPKLFQTVHGQKQKSSYVMKAIMRTIQLAKGSVIPLAPVVLTELGKVSFVALTC